jgi:hypothetical protein
VLLNNPPTLAFVRPADLDNREQMNGPACSDAELIEAVQSWMCGAPDAEVEKILNCNRKNMLKQYVKRRGWQYLVETIREDVRRIALSSITRVTNRCLTMIEERIETGDPVYDGEGNIVGRRAVRVRDLGNIASQMIDRQGMLEKGLSRTDEEPMTRAQIAESLRNWLHSKRASESKIIDVESDTLQ